MDDKQHITINPLIARRRSPRAYSDRKIDDTTLNTLFEAARWAPSCNNGQPWRFLYAHAGTPAFDKLLQTADEFNRQWAKNASVLMLSVAKRHFDHNGKPNTYAWHDVGMAMQNLAIQATELGVIVHQMGGFNSAAARNTFGIPDGFEPVALTAIGYPGSKESLPESLRQKDDAPRVRKPVEEFVFEGEWPETQ